MNMPEEGLPEISFALLPLYEALWCDDLCRCIFLEICFTLALWNDVDTCQNFLLQ